MHSISEDPLFEDPAQDDFRLKPDSPAHALGFKDIDMSRIGLDREFPHHWLAFDDTHDEATVEYDRGRDPEKKNYEWW